MVYDLLGSHSYSAMADSSVDDSIHHENGDAHGTGKNQEAGGDIDEDQTFFINPALQVVFCGNDEILVLHGSRSDFREVIRDEGKTKVLGRVLRHMEEPTSLSDLRVEGVLAESELENARAIFSNLVDENILVDAAERLASVYMDTLYDDTTPLIDASVGVVGAGPLGARVVDELARLDVGELHVFDDRVTTDLDFDRRQFGGITPYVEEGKPYVEALGITLAIFGGHEAKKRNHDDAPEVKG